MPFPPRVIAKSMGALLLSDINCLIKAHIEIYKEERDRHKKHSPEWTKADAALSALQDLMKSIKSH